MLAGSVLVGIMDRHMIGRLSHQALARGLRRVSLSGRYAWLVFAGSCAAYILLSLAHHQPFHPGGRLGYFDLRVYRGAAHLVLTDGPLYDTRLVRWAHFTYPPLAAVALTPLAIFSLAVDEVLVTGVNVAALVAVLWFALQLPWGRSERDRQPSNLGAWSMVVVAAAAALWLDPITATLGYGQINLVIALMIVYDLSRRDTAKTKGAMIGLAAGLKLTPLIFVPYLLLSRRVRAAFVALGAFAATIALAFPLVPAAAQRYWGSLVLNTDRTGGAYTPTNQSLRGAILGLAPSFGSAWLIAVASIVAIAGIAVAALASRRGDEAVGFSICALTGLLVSPVSWAHHWTLAVPALVLLAARTYGQTSSVGLIAIAGVALIGYSYLPEIVTNVWRHTLDQHVYPGRIGLPFGWTLAADSYVLLGLAVLAVACGHEYRTSRSVVP
ncbi:MAG TPA: glycosyltransferase 87 family protein [Solirubrobacteraceae bacterium]